MAQKKSRLTYPARKISATFLEFAEPLLEPLGPEATKHEMETSLQIAFTVWNAVVLDTTEGGNVWVNSLIEATRVDPRLESLMTELIARKRRRYGRDQRLIGLYEFFHQDGELKLRVEARDPTSGRGVPKSPK